MNIPIYDCELHELNNEYGYVAQLTQDDNIPFYEYTEKVLKKYAEYIYENDKEKCISYILKDLSTNVFFLPQSKNSDFTFIYRPPWVTGCLSEAGSLVLKFRRVKNDKLVEKNDKVRTTRKK